MPEDPKAAIDADQAWLAVVAIVNSIVSLFYYLRVLAPAILDPAGPDTVAPRRATDSLSGALAVAALATAALGVAAQPVLELADSATMLMR